MGTLITGVVRIFTGGVERLDCIDKLNRLVKVSDPGDAILDFRLLITLYTSEKGVAKNYIASHLGMSTSAFGRLASNQNVMDNEGRIRETLRKYAATLNYADLRKRLDELETFSKYICLEDAKEEMKELMRNYNEEQKIIPSKAAQFTFNLEHSWVYMDNSQGMWVILYEQANDAVTATEILRSFLLSSYPRFHLANYPIRVSFAMQDKKDFRAVFKAWTQKGPDNPLHDIDEPLRDVMLTIILIDPVKNQVMEEHVIQFPKQDTAKPIRRAKKKTPKQQDRTS